VGLGDLRLASIYRRYLDTHDNSILPDAEPAMGLFYSNHEGFAELFTKAVDAVADFDQGRISSKDATRKIFDLMANCKFTAPPAGLADPKKKFINVGAPATLLRTFGWVMTSAPPEIKSWTLNALGPLKHLAPKIKPAMATGM